MDDDRKARLERLNTKYYFYLQHRNPKEAKWITEDHLGIHTAFLNLSNAVEKAIKEGRAWTKTGWNGF